MFQGGLTWDDGELNLNYVTNSLFLRSIFSTSQLSNKKNPILYV